jgi:hypothetical protein
MDIPLIMNKLSIFSQAILLILSLLPLQALDTLRIDLSGHPGDRLTITSTGYSFLNMEEIPVSDDVRYLITGGDFNLDLDRGDCSTDVFIDISYTHPITWLNAHVYNLRYQNDAAFPQTMYLRGYNQVIRFAQQALYLHTDSHTPLWYLSGDSLLAETHDTLYHMAALAAGGKGSVRCIDLDMDFIDLRGSNGGIGTRDGADIDTVRVRRGVVSCCGIHRSVNRAKQVVIHTGASFKAALLEFGTWRFVPAGSDTWGSASLIPWGPASYQIRPVNELGIKVYCVRVPHSGQHSVSVDNDFAVRTWTFSAHHPQDPCFYLWLPAGDYTITTPAGLRRYIELENNDIDLLPFAPPPPSDRISGDRIPAPSQRWDIYTLDGKWVEGGTFPQTPSPSTSLSPAGIYILKDDAGSRLILGRRF